MWGFSWICWFKNDVLWYSPIWPHSDSYPRLSYTQNPYRYAVMVWFSEPGCLGICYFTYSATISRSCQKSLAILFQVWDTNLDKIFQNSKSVLINQVTEEIQTFDVNKPTCIQTDWNKGGLGYLLLQKRCPCPMGRAPTCCWNGWRLVCVGSCFTHGGDTNYSPTEGESLGSAWSLNHVRMFVLSVKHSSLSHTSSHVWVYLITGNHPVFLISGSASSKKKTAHNFKIQHNPGKWNWKADVFLDILLIWKKHELVYIWTDV